MEQGDAPGNARQMAGVSNVQSAAADEAGTPPGDRSFRPDVQGLRALAVALVVLYHANIPKLTGGYVGVDSFFVISGFVITGLLLRERSRFNRNSFAAFYARRARRLLPAATVVIVLTIIAAFHFLGYVGGGQVAPDANAAALFVANFHFIHLGTNYATAQAPPSPFQHFWSLAVEEQFYLIYPTLFILSAVVWKKVRLETKLTVLLCVVVATSYIWSIIATRSDAIAAYFSPFTRAWELALGALVAVLSPKIGKILSTNLATVLTWLGGAAIIASAFIFNNATAFPGSLAAIPVVGTAVTIAAGAVAPKYGIELILRNRAVQWIGAISYGLYLTHWPILTIATQETTAHLGLLHRLILVAVAVAAAALMYKFIEGPIRHSKSLAKSNPKSLALIPICIAVSLLVVALELHLNHLPVSFSPQSFSVVWRPVLLGF